MRTRGQSGGRRPAWTSWTPTPEPASTRNRSSARETSVAGPRRAGLGGGEPVPRSTARMAIELRGGLRPASEASTWDALRTAGRRGAGAPPSEASSRKSAPAKLALERRSRRASFLQRGPQDRVGSISVQAPAPALLNSARRLGVVTNAAAAAGGVVCAPGRPGGVGPPSPVRSSKSCVRESGWRSPAAGGRTRRQDPQPLRHARAITPNRGGLFGPPPRLGCAGKAGARGEISQARSQLGGRA